MCDNIRVIEVEGVERLNEIISAMQHAGLDTEVDYHTSDHAVARAVKVPAIKTVFDNIHWWDDKDESERLEREESNEAEWAERDAIHESHLYWQRQAA